jgi:CDP-2,3-bis-(O-geranylgeranyl)-sn-glycerol synthase
MMNLDIINLIIFCLNVVYFLLPAYIANLSGLTLGGTTPVDGGKNFIDGRRLIGNGVTWKGLIFGTIVGTLVGLIQGFILISFFSKTFIDYSQGFVILDIYSGILIGFLLSIGALLGDGVGSFIKRRLNIDRGKPAPLLDQLDFYIGAILLVSLVVKLNPTFIAVGAIITLILHLLTNSIAYFIGMKDVWY